MKRKTRVSGVRKLAGGKIERKAARRNRAGGQVVRRKLGTRTGAGVKGAGKTSRSAKIGSLKASGEGWGIGRDPLTGSRGGPRANKKRITLYLDADVLAWFKEKPKYQKEINRALREVMRGGGDRYGE
jgi:BrnA antitoxin of type II toxin-antitoxin system